MRFRCVSFARTAMDVSVCKGPVRLSFRFAFDIRHSNQQCTSFPVKMNAIHPDVGWSAVYCFRPWNYTENHTCARCGWVRTAVHHNYSGRDEKSFVLRHFFIPPSDADSMPSVCVCVSPGWGWRLNRKKKTKMKKKLSALIVKVQRRKQPKLFLHELWDAFTIFSHEIPLNECASLFFLRWTKHVGEREWCTGTAKARQIVRTEWHRQYLECAEIQGCFVVARFHWKWWHWRHRWSGTR